MAFVVENGTGLANANSYASVAEFDAYWEDRGELDLVSSNTDSAKEAALVLATDWLDITFRWRGIKKNADPDPGVAEQALEWPREAAYDPHTRRRVDENSVPVDVKRAAIEAARVALTEDLMPTQTSAVQSIVSESVGAGPLRRTRQYIGRITTAPYMRKAIGRLERLRAAHELWRA